MKHTGKKIQSDLWRLRNLYMTGLIFVAYYDGEEPYDEYGTDRIGYRTAGDPGIHFEYSDCLEDHPRNLYGMIAELARAVVHLRIGAYAERVKDFVNGYDEEQWEFYEKMVADYKVGKRRPALRVLREDGEHNLDQP